MTYTTGQVAEGIWQDGILTAPPAGTPEAPAKARPPRNRPQAPELRAVKQLRRCRGKALSFALGVAVGGCCC